MKRQKKLAKLTLPDPRMVRSWVFAPKQPDPAMAEFAQLYRDFVAQVREVAQEEQR